MGWTIWLPTCWHSIVSTFHTDGVAVDHMSSAEAEQRAAQLCLSYTAALKLVYEQLESRHYSQVRAKLTETGRYTGLNICMTLVYVEVSGASPGDSAADGCGELNASGYTCSSQVRVWRRCQRRRPSRLNSSSVRTTFTRSARATL